MNRNALFTVGLLLLGLALVPGHSPAKARGKIYYLTVSGHGTTTSTNTGPREDFSSDTCSEFHQSTSKATLSATLGKPKKILFPGPIASFGSHFTMDLRVRLSNGHATYDDRETGSQSAKSPGGCTDTFTPSAQKGSCTLSGPAKTPYGIVFAVAAQKGRVTIAQNQEGDDLFKQAGRDGCRAVSDSGGFLNYPTIVTKLKLSAIKALAAHHHVTVKGHYVRTAAPVPKPTNGSVFHRKVDLSYTITATRSR
jgi:hypothetical protein